jgi:Cd2+/Zn2+-exporting ATPase
MSHPHQPPWIATLAEFLRHETGVEAMLLNPEERSVSLATLGHVDAQALQERLSAVLASLDKSTLSPPESDTMEGGVMLKAMASQTLLEKPSCPTAPRLWQWRDFSWPSPEELEEQSEEEWKLMAMQAGICGLGLIAGWALERWQIGPWWLSRIGYLIALISGGWDAAKDAWESIKERRLDVHFLMLAVAVGAVTVGAWTEGALLLFLFSSSGAMEHYALHRTHKEINALTKGAPKTANVLQADGSTLPKPVSLLVPGDLILVKPDEIYPADGDIKEGKTATDESTLTGESVAVEKSLGDSVLSGTLNLWGAVTVKVTRLAKESALQKIITLIQDAQHQRAPSQRFTDRFGTGYTLGILGLTLVMFFVWWLGFHLPPFDNTGDQKSAFYRAMTLLVVASPCALVLSIPSAILAAIASGARRGILFRGGAAIEKLAEIDTVAMDKTGTLTMGEPRVEAVESFPPGREQAVAQIAFSMEVASNHPLARAITAYGKAQNYTALAMTDFSSLTGLGLRAQIDGQVTYLGRRELLEQGEFAQWLAKVPDAPVSFTEVWIVQGTLLGRLLLQDTIRQESKAVLATLHEKKMHTIMLTGDRRSAAENVAKELGLQEVRAGLSPEDKLKIITDLGKAGHKVAMIGDGVNDAPSLAAAYVSVAMGGRGSDAALEQSDLALMNDRIDKFVDALDLSQRARTIIRQNLAISLGTVLLMVISSLLGQVPLTLGVMAHEGSTVLVCLNSLRLLFGGRK